MSIARVMSHATMNTEAASKRAEAIEYQSDDDYETQQAQEQRACREACQIGEYAPKAKQRAQSMAEAERWRLRDE